MTVKHPVRRASAVDIIDVLADVPRATLAKISDDTGRHVTGLYRNLTLLLDRRLIEEAGAVVTYGTRRTAMTYRLHPRVRKTI